MNKLIRLELKRNSLKPYHLTVIIITVVIFCFLYLLAAIPRIDVSDAEMFMLLSGKLIAASICKLKLTF